MSTQDIRNPKWPPKMEENETFYSENLFTVKI